MRLEGTLDAFSLPDIFQLLSFTKKTGTLHLRREVAGGLQHGAVHLRQGAVTGGRSDVTRHELARRLLGAGLVDDEVLASAAEAVAGDDTLSLAQVLAERAALDSEAIRSVAAEQATDTVFSLLRWPEGEFAFVVDEADPDDLGAAVPVEQVVTEGQRRLEAWSELSEQVPDQSSVLAVNAAPSQDPVAGRDEWSLLSLVDGRRSVGDIVTLSGRGEFAVVTALAGLVTRGLLTVRTSVEDQQARRQSLLAALEGRVEAPSEVAAGNARPVDSQAADQRRDSAPDQSGRVPQQQSGPVIPERPEPFTAPRRPDHPEPAPSYARSSGGPSAQAAHVNGHVGHGSVDGATALQPDPVASSLIERDPSVNKSLLLRLIAGVRGL